MAHVIFGREYPEQVDAVVIGSGIGGLVCANLLAQGGMKVLLIERHSMLGGFCYTFRRKGFIFDAATHFYPLLGNPTTLTGKILHDLGIETEWVKMDPVDRFHLPNLPAFAVPADFGEYLDKLKTWFPEEAAAIDRYFAELRQAYLYGLLYYFFPIWVLHEASGELLLSGFVQSTLEVELPPGSLLISDPQIGRAHV